MVSAMPTLSRSGHVNWRRDERAHHRSVLLDSVCPAPDPSHGGGTARRSPAQPGAAPATIIIIIITTQVPPPAAQRRGRELVAFLVHGRTASALVHVEDVDHDDDIVHLEDALLEHQSSTLLSAEPTPTARFFKQDFQKPQLQESMHGTSRFRNTFFPVIKKHKAYSNSNFARTGFTLIMQPHPM